MFGPLKTLLFLAVLWLPLSFFVWFYFAQVFVMPVAALSSSILQGWLPQVFTDMEQTRHIIEFITSLPVKPEMLVGLDTSQGTPAVVVEVNPMIYGYSIPVLSGLVMATPLTGTRRLLQIGAGVVILTLVQTFGAVFDALKSVTLQSGAEGVRLIAETGLSPNLIAFGYQFGYLVLPAITPVILWVMFNQAFIQLLVSAPGNEFPDEGTDGPGGGS